MLLLLVSRIIQASGSVNLSLLTFEGNYVPDYQPLSVLKGRENGQPAALQGVTVTAVFSNYFYVEEAKHVGGIRVNWSSTMPAEGALVNVVGTMATRDGERSIDAEIVE